MESIRSKLLEVHNEYIRKLQDFESMYEEHARISQVGLISTAKRSLRCRSMVMLSSFHLSVFG